MNKQDTQTSPDKIYINLQLTSDILKSIDIDAEIENEETLHRLKTFIFDLSILCKKLEKISEKDATVEALIECRDKLLSANKSGKSLKELLADTYDENTHLFTTTRRQAL